MPDSSSDRVNVFHFTSRISNAKIRKYKQATERGMAPLKTRSSASRTGRAASTFSNGSELTADSPALSNESQSVEPPPAKKPRLKLSVRERKPEPKVKSKAKPKEDHSNTIAASRSRRSTKRKSYNDPDEEDDLVMTEDTPEIESAKARSPAPSSGLSSLESAPPSPREESPFRDPTPPGSATRADYGDFMSYYIAGGDEESEPEQVAPKGKRKSRSQAKPAKKVETAKALKVGKQPTPPSPKATPQTATPVEQKTQATPQPPQQQPGPQQGPYVTNQQPPSQQIQNGPGPRQRVSNGPPRLPQGPPPPGMHRPPPLPPSNPPPPMPQPVIHFIDITHDPKPTEPDTIADMIKKLETLSSALTNFGGVPAVPATPPPEGKPAPAKKAPAKKQPAKKQPAPQSSNQIDGFLSLFDADDDDDDSSSNRAEDDEEEEGEPQEENLNVLQTSPGNPDGPLTYGIQFIQNALKSWAQQRTTHQITHQLQLQHNQALAEYYQSQQNRGPGRPRKFVEPLPGQPGGPRPILQMDLADTPEGVAIKAFQRVLDSGCLQVNATLHAGLSRALRHLYMQIDHLINQGTKENTNWQCMSYGAQISAHRFRVEQVKHARAQADEMQRQQRMASMHQGQPQMSAVQAQHTSAIDLERRRSMQHAQQQPYIAAQHLNPLNLNGSTSATPAGPSLSPAPNGVNQGQSMGHPQQNDPSSMATGGANGVNLDKVKIYMPGFLPRSGQSMKFSFAPHSEAAVQAFGSDAFPTEQPLGPRIPNRGPMSAPPAQADRPMPDAQPTTIDLTSDEPEPTASHPQVQVPSLKTGSGFTAVNKPAPNPAIARPASVPAGSPNGTSSMQKPTSGTASASTSPALGNGSIQMNGRSRAADMAARMPHPGAVVEDK